MLDLILRFLKHPVDYFGMFIGHTLVLKERIQESEHIYSFIFEPQQKLNWKAGQHAIFRFPGTKMSGGNFRPFSVASAPHESVIRIGTIVGDQPSEFKQKLMSLTAGDTIRMNGPFGEFHTSDSITHIIGIAGGIGITPFRALLADLAHTKGKTPVTLIYSARDNLHAYKADLDTYAATANIEIIYTATSEEVQTALADLADINGSKAHYFISGAPGMITALTKSCQELGAKHIVTDPFKGY